MDTGCRMVGARSGQEWPGEGSCLMGTEFQFLKMKGDLRLGGGDGCTTI